MYFSLKGLFFVAILVSSILTTPSFADTCNTSLYVIRIDGLSNPSIESKSSVIDNQTIGEYPTLQNLIQQADVKYEKLSTINYGHGEMPSEPVQSPSASVCISNDLANSIINNVSLHFQKDDSTTYHSYFKIGNAVYSAQISGVTEYSVNPSPFKQIKNGVSGYDVKCKSGFSLIIKTSDDSPACVKPSTAQKLVERGWGVLNEQTVWFEYTPLQCQQTPWDEHWNKLYANSTFGDRIISPMSIIKTYFGDQGIIILEAKQIIPLANMTPVPLCGGQSDIVFYFLVSESDANKMIKLGYKTFTIPLPSNAVPVQ